MRIEASIVTLAALAIGCGGRAAAAGSASPPSTARAACSDAPVALRFAWPADLGAGVTGHDLTESANSDGSSPMRGDSWADLRLQVRPDPEGVRVRFVTEGRSRVRSQGLAPEIFGARPELRLDASGRVIGVEGTAAMRESIQEALRRGAVTAEQAGVLSANATDEAQYATAAAHWGWLLHAWNGRSLACGEVVRTSARVPALSFGSAAVDTDTELTYAGRSECARGGVARSCAVLEAQQRDVGGSAARAIAGSGIAAGRASVEGAWFVRTVRALAEPETLILHRVEFEERWEIRWRTGAGPTTRYIRDLQSYEFDYDRPAAAAPRRQWIVTREGAAPRPDTPLCRWVDACCATLGASLVGQLICVGIPRDGATDCTAEDVAAVRGAAGTLEGGAPPVCDTSP